MFKLSYTIKDDNGYLVEKTRSFRKIEDVAKLIRKLVNENKIIGKPIIERV